MSDTAIRAEGLGKRYRIGARASTPTTRRGSLARLLSAPFAYLGASLREPSEDETLWALRDVTFTVGQGEVVGVIGRNGAGKTTLLRILSRITDPTSGGADIFGRVGSLLEVGTGFHPELTGRENVFLNGAIHGMRRGEIERKFDEIVAFSGVERFLDTPVKRYSSGMRVRLAFSVAAHLEPEILLIDEVLAVGDSAFQRRCLGKMEEIGESGRTVLFVSHSMPTVSRLCARTILLDRGRVVDDGPSERVVARYLNMGLGTVAERRWDDPQTAPATDFVRMRSVRVVDDASATLENADVRRPVGIELVFAVLERKTPFVPLIELRNEQGVRIFIAIDTDAAWKEPREPGIYTSTAWIPGNLLSEGTLMISVFLTTLAPGWNVHHVKVRDAVAFHAFDPGEGDSAKGEFMRPWNTAVSPLLEWTTQRAEPSQS